MVARYQNPAAGRFISIDPMIQAIGGDLSKFDKSLNELLANPQSLNSYSYTINNPLKYNDPTGETATEAAGGYFVGLGQGLWNTVKGVANSVAHPVNAVKNVGNSIVAAGNAWKQLASGLKADAKGTLSQINEGAQIGYNEFMDSSDYEKGKAIGNITEKTMEIVTVKKMSEGMAKIGSNEGLQLGKYNVKMDSYPNAGGGGLNLRDATLSNNPAKQRIFGIDYHKFNYNGVEKPRLHYHSGSSQEIKTHKPWGNNK
jgi:RHS repeat-associated protein